MATLSCLNNFNIHVLKFEVQTLEISFRLEFYASSMYISLDIVSNEITQSIKTTTYKSDDFILIS